MNMLTSIKNRLHIGREIPMGKNSKTGETEAKIDTEDKVSISSGSGEDNNSMSLKNAATSGGVGFAIGLGVGNNGRIKNLENEMNTMKSGKMPDTPTKMENGKEPPITQREFKAIKMISRKAFRENFIDKDFGAPAIFIGMCGILPALVLAPTVTIGLGALGAVMIAGETIRGISSGNAASKKAQRNWLGEFRNKSEAESMVELNSKHPDIWMKMMKNK
ncbi:MAG: hypothetical protein K8T10_09745 [Candidatus Eremiobacteraeota bacterium]|nr:hypothetical protein [Candidatus Eremiobacteraeota bacterium]